MCFQANCLENMHVKQVCLSIQCLSLVDKDNKVNAVVVRGTLDS